MSLSFADIKLNTLTGTGEPLRITTAQRDALTPLPEGLEIYNTTEQNKQQCDGRKWVDITPKRFKLTDTWTIWGDSYNTTNYAGASITWAEFLATNTGTSYVNKAISGRFADYAFSRSDDFGTYILTDPYVTNSSAIIQIGTNDVWHHGDEQANDYIWRAIYLNFAFSLAVPHAKMYDARLSGYTESGTWSSPPDNTYGREPNTINAYTERIITDRYLFVSCTILQNKTVTFNITVDGEVIDSQKIVTTTLSTPGITTAIGFVYDLGTAASRTVRYTHLSTTIGFGLILNFMASWNDEDTNLRNVLCIDIPGVIDIQTKTGGTSDYATRNRLNTNIKEVVEIGRSFGLKVFYQPYNNPGGIYSNFDHPSTHGQRTKAKLIQKVIRY